MVAQRLATRLTSTLYTPLLFRGLRTTSTHPTELAAITSESGQATEEISTPKCTTNEETGAARVTHETRENDQLLPIGVNTVGETARRAFALEKNVADRLTPTLKRFTLEGKVAVVTG